MIGHSPIPTPRAPASPWRHVGLSVLLFVATSALSSACNGSVPPATHIAAPPQTATAEPTPPQTATAEPTPPQTATPDAAAPPQRQQKMAPIAIEPPKPPEPTAPRRPAAIPSHRPRRSPQALAMTPSAAPESPPLSPKAPANPAPLSAALQSSIANTPFPGLVSAVYAALGGGPLFFDALTPKPAAAQLVALVAELPKHALPKTPYGLPNPWVPPKNATEAAALDARLTAAVVRYVLDFRFIYRAHPALVTRDLPALVAAHRAAIVQTTTALFPDVIAGLKALWPTDPRYAAIQAAIPRFEALAKRDKERPEPHVDWRTRSIQAGEHDAKVRVVQQRLHFEGYYDGPLTGTLDKPTQAAVSRFQEEHFLAPDGILGKSTLKAMNVSMRARLNQLRVGLHRLRERRPLREGATDYIEVDLAAYTLRLVENGQLTQTHRVIVGSNKLEYNRLKWQQGHLNRTPIMKTFLYRVVLNPVWIIPKRIRQQEVTAASAARKGYREVNSAKGNFLIQGPGKSNALGRIKFLLENTNAIYLHDTNKRHLFARFDRARSHGCVRVDGALELGRHLLDTRAGIPGTEVERILKTNKTRAIDLKAPLRVYSTYNTIGLLPDGRILFHEDVYQFDRAFARGELPPRRWTRFGSPAMRPRGVPRLPFSDFKRLKAAGGMAPMVWPPKTASQSAP